MKTKTVNVYEFDELDEAAKEKARDWYRSGSSGENSWSEYTIGEVAREAELMGIEFKERPVQLANGCSRGEPCVFWSGFSSQGDGACFEGTWSASAVKADKVAIDWVDSPMTTEITRIAKAFADFAKKYPDASFTVRHSGHYRHEHCTEFDFEIVGDDETQITDAEIEEAEKALKEAAKDFMRYIYRALEQDWEFQNSDEQVDESIAANEYGFTEDGDRRVTL